jgi:hypothetical protein
MTFRKWGLALVSGLLAVLAGGLAQPASAGDEDYVEGDGDFVFCNSFQEVLEWKDADAGKPFQPGATINEKDNAGKIDRFLFTAETVSNRKMFKDLDLAGKAGVWNMAILVDDAATVTVVPADGTPPAPLPRCKGGALWSDAAFHVLSYSFLGGKSYRINFDYSNTCHFNHPDIMEDYDGIIAYLYPATTIDCPACHHAVHLPAACQTAGCTCGLPPPSCPACNHAVHLPAACQTTGCACGHPPPPCPACNHAVHLPEACQTAGCTCGQCPHCHHASHLPAACPQTGCPCPATYLLEASEITPATIRVGESATATLEFLRRMSIPFIDGTTGTYTVDWSFQVRYKPLQDAAWQSAAAGDCATALSHVETRILDTLAEDRERLTFTPNKPGYWEIAAIATTTRIPNAADGTVLATSRTVKTWTVTAWDFGMKVADPTLDNAWLTPAQALDPGAMMNSGGEMITVELICAPADYLQGQITLTKTSGTDLQFWTPESLAGTPPQGQASWTGTGAKTLYVGGTAAGIAMLHAEFLPAGAADPFTADAKVTIVKLTLSPNSGPLGTKVNIAMSPANLNLFSAETTASGSGKFTSTTGSSTGTIAASYPKEKIYFSADSPDEIGLVIGDVKPSVSFADQWLISRAAGGTCNGTVQTIAAGRKFSTPFTFTPSDDLCLGRITVDENGQECFTAINYFCPGSAHQVQAFIKNEAGVIPPSTILVKVRSLDANGDLIEPPAGCAPASQTLTLQKVGENNGNHVYRSSLEASIIPYRGSSSMGNVNYPAQSLLLYFVYDGELEVIYE